MRTLLLAFFALACSGGDQDTSEGGDDPSCSSAWGLRDSATDLCWENPSDEVYRAWDEAIAACESSTVGDASDWRLPDIDELASLLRGCDDGVVTSADDESSCSMEPEGCAATDSCVGTSDCGACAYYEGPADDGCYWLDGLAGSCTNAYWSSSTDGGNGVNPWFVTFGDGAIGGQGPSTSAFLVRCVRGG